MTVDTKKRFIINTAFVVLILIMIYFVLKYLTVWLMPFLIGFVCALVLNKPVTFLSQKTKIPRGIWSLVLVAVLLSVLFGGLAFLGYRLYDQLLALVAKLTGMIPSLRESFSDLGSRFSGWLNNLPPQYAQTLRSSPGQLLESAITYVTGLLTNLATGVLVNVPSLILTTVISVVACCFITIDYTKIANFILCQFSLRTQKVLLKSKRVFTENILKMFRGYLLVMLVTFCELLIGFWIIKVPYAAALALLVAIVDIFPVLGTGTVLLPWGVISLLMGNTRTGLGVLLLYAVITVVRNVIEPKIIGDQVGLPAIVTLIAMYLGLRLFGVTGMFGLPLILIVVVKLQTAGMLHIWKDGSRISASVAEERRNAQSE